MQLKQIVKYISNHPLNKHNKIGSVMRFFKWQFISRISKKGIVYSFTNNSKLIVKRGLAGATGNYYCGLHEFEEMGFLLHLLREADTFVDIGANIGSFTVLASAHCKSKTISFEPAPATFNYLLENIAVNKIGDKVTAINMAVGSEKSTVLFTAGEDTTNHVSEENEQGGIKVNVESLDTLLQNYSPPILIKIDVEGYETEVIKGASQTLNNHELKAIIIELGGAGARYGYDENEIHKTLLNAGFLSYHYNPLQRQLRADDGNHAHSSLYIRDLQIVQKRIQSAPLVVIRKMEF